MKPRQEKALQALLSCRTKSEAAEVAGVAVSTLRAYLKDPEFVAAYRTAISDQLSDAARQGRGNISEALDVLKEIMVSGTQEQNRITAARATIDTALRLGEQADVMQQLQELEQWRMEVSSRG